LNQSEKLYTAIWNFWKDHVGRASRVCVAVSGGSDSVTLFHLLYRLKERLSITALGIAHVNHRLRGRESDGDAAFVKNIAARCRVPYYEKTALLKDIPGTGIEEWARNLRYGFFRRVRTSKRYDYIATAHTADDQAETVLLRLMRGTGLAGLCAITPVRLDGVIRPLLDVQRADLRAWLERNNFGFREDSSNADTRYTRNWVRHELLPLLVKKQPSAVKHLASIASHSQTLTAALSLAVNKWIDSNVVKKGSSCFFVKKAGLADTALGGEAIASLLRDHKIRFDQAHVESVLRSRARRSGTFLLPDAWRFDVGKDSLEFYRGTKPEKARGFSCRLPLSGTVRCRDAGAIFTVERLAGDPGKKISFRNPMVAHVDARLVKRPLTFRRVKKGDVFRPYGEKGQREVIGFLKKQKIPRAEREKTGVIAMRNGQILWVVGLRVDHRFRITETTKEILKISCKRPA
jgi:tRNA(Ile)-lysidine synthase